jgi:hypothetical protein
VFFLSGSHPTRCDLLPQALSGWLASQAGNFPLALAMKGKMNLDQVDLLTLANYKGVMPYSVARPILPPKTSFFG